MSCLPWPLRATGMWSAVQVALMVCAVPYCVVQGFADPGPEASNSLRLQPDEPELHRTANASFAVTCSGLQPEWLGPKDKPLRQSGRLSVSGNDTHQLLVFSSVTEAESGKYTCKSKKDSSKKSFNLEITEPVSFGKPPEPKARQNDNATMVCSPRGKPAPEIAWLRNGMLVSNESGKFVITGKKLMVKNVTRFDAGSYVCRAIQYMPDESLLLEQTINLTVEHGPEWHGDYAKNGLVYGYLGGLANLTCVAEAQPVGTIIWLKGNKVINSSINATIYGDGRNSTLQLNLTDASLFGEYTCEAKNNLDRRERILSLKWGLRAERPSKPQPMKAADARHALIRVDQPPPPTAPPTAAGPGSNRPMALDLTGLRLLVRPAHGPAANDPNALRVVDLPFNEDNEYTLPDLEPNTWYEVRAQWRNAAGLSEVSEAGEIHTSENGNSATKRRVVLPLLALPLLAISVSSILTSAAASILMTNVILSSGAILSS